MGQTLPWVLYTGDGHKAGWKWQMPASGLPSRAEDGERCQCSSEGWSPSPRLSLYPFARQLSSPRAPSQPYSWDVFPERGARGPHVPSSGGLVFPVFITKQGPAFHF